MSTAEAKQLYGSALLVKQFGLQYMLQKCRDNSAFPAREGDDMQMAAVRKEKADRIVLRGDRVRQAREAQGWSQHELEKQMGLAGGIISRYERGLHKPQPEMLAELALVLRVSADWLLGISDDPALSRKGQPLSPEEVILVEMFRSGDFERRFNEWLRSLPLPFHKGSEQPPESEAE